MKYAPFFIAWAEVPYEDVDYKEIRPVLILSGSQKDESKTLCEKITSKSPRPNCNDLQISNSIQIGLPLLSTIRLDNLIYIHDDTIYERIGRLSTHDIKNVKRTLIKILNERKDTD